MTGLTRIVAAVVLSIAVGFAAVLSINTVHPGAGVVGTVLVPGLLAGLVAGVALRPIGRWWPALLSAALTGMSLSAAAVVVRVSGGYDAVASGAVLVAVLIAVSHAGAALVVQRLTGEPAPARRDRRQHLVADW